MVEELKALHGLFGFHEKDELQLTQNTIIRTRRSMRMWRTFLSSELKRAEFFSSKHKNISNFRIPLASPDADLRSDIAERIYDIRCKIVHTKDVGETDEETTGLLLPFSKEAELMTYDIELVEYIAQQVLITSGTNLRYTA